MKAQLKQQQTNIRYETSRWLSYLQNLAEAFPPNSIQGNNIFGETENYKK